MMKCTAVHLIDCESCIPIFKNFTQFVIRIVNDIIRAFTYKFFSKLIYNNSKSHFIAIVTGVLVVDIKNIPQQHSHHKAT